MGDAVVHFEILEPDDVLAAKFYSELFGWHTEAKPEMQYTLVDTHASGGINGGIGKAEGTSWSTFYVEVADPQAALDKAESLGGKTTMPVMEIPGVVTYAQFTDLDGLVIGLVKSGSEEMKVEGSNAPLAWFEIASPDPERAWKFYSELFGWHVSKIGRAHV